MIISIFILWWRTCSLLLARACVHVSAGRQDTNLFSTSIFFFDIDFLDFHSVFLVSFFSFYRVNASCSFVMCIHACTVFNLTDLHFSDIDPLHFSIFEFSFSHFIFICVRVHSKVQPDFNFWVFSIFQSSFFSDFHYASFHFFIFGHSVLPLETWMQFCRFP